MLLLFAPAHALAAQGPPATRVPGAATCKRVRPRAHRTKCCDQLEAAQPEKARARGPRVSIAYCTGCRWGLRAGWMAQELLVTFEGALGEVALCPSDAAGTFDVCVDGECVWSRSRDGGFPELKVVKQRVRDVVQPGRALGHSDGRGRAAAAEGSG